MRLLKWKGLEIDPSKLSESVVIQPQILPESVEAFKEAKSDKKKQYLLPRIEAIHAGTTRNHNRYPAEKLKGDKELKSGVYSWLHPYPKPVIFNHDTHTKPTGRVQSAAFTEHTSSGKPGVVVIPKITDEETIDAILEGRLLTVSVGATTDAAICSICGTNILEEYCGHWKGEIYDGIKAEWIVGNLWFDELSWVNVPADQNAMVIDKGEPQTVESFAFNGREIIDLGKKTTEWLVDPKVAVSEGLLAPEKKEGIVADIITREKGDGTLPGQKEIQALQEQLESANRQLEEMKQQLEQAEAAKQEAENALAEKESKLQEAESKLAEAEQKLSEQATELSQLQEANGALEEEKSQLQKALDEATNKNQELTQELHKVLAGTVVDLRIHLGKESDREEALEKYMARTIESLKDTIADLFAEANEVSARTIERVEHPGADIVGGKEDSAKPETNEKKMTNQDVLVALLKGVPNQKRLKK